MGFPRQEHWSGLPFSSPGDLPDPGIESRSPPLQMDSLLTASREALLGKIYEASVFRNGTILSGLWF